MTSLFNAMVLRTLITAPLLCLLLLCAGCAMNGKTTSDADGAASSQRSSPTLVLYNDPPIIAHFSFPETTHAQGEFIAWHADLDDAAGKGANRIGQCNGTMMVTRRNDEHEDDREHRMTTIELDWDDSDDSLLIAGSHPYQHGAIQTDTPMVRAVTGGTGRFMFARGQMVSTRLDSGWYRHEIWLAD
jgi:hypothetical protein